MRPNKHQKDHPQHKDHPQQKEQLQQKELAGCIRKQSLSGPFEEKAGSQRTEARQKHQEFSIIMESIKDVLRSNEKQSQ